MNKKKRILVLTSTFPRWHGDTEPPFVFELCERLGEEFDILVLAPHAKGAKSLERMGNLDVIRFRYFFQRWEKLSYDGGILANLKQNRWRYLLLPLFFSFQLVTILRILHRENIDLIHVHWLIPQGLSASIAGLFVKKMPPLICTSHGGDLMGLNGRLLTILKRWIIRSSSRVTVVSHAMEADALALGARSEELKTISMGVDASALFAPCPDAHRESRELLFVGRLVVKKGLAFLIAAMPEIVKQKPGTRLSIVGDGPLKNALKDQVNQLGLTDIVTFHGAVNNLQLPKLYRRASVFVAPSIVTNQGDQEGLGLVLVEALACECPVVSSGLPAIKDVIIQGVTGLSVPEKNPEAIAKAVLKLLSDRSFRTQLAMNGRHHAVRNFDWTVVSSRYASLFHELI